MKPPAALVLAATVLAAGLLPAGGVAADEPPPPSAPSPPGVAVVGDSVAFKARDQLAQRLDAGRPLQALLAANAAQIDTSLPVVEEALAAADVPPIWVVVLGHAYTDRRHPLAKVRADVRAMLAAVAPRVDCVRWLDITTRRTFYAGVNEGAPTFNRILREEAARFANVEVMPYAHWARIAPESVWTADGLHHTLAGKAQMAELVRQAADGCDPATNSGPYWDVADAWSEAGAVRALHDLGALTGRADRTYRSRLGLEEVVATRGVVATTLWRRAGSPAGRPRPPWTDVSRSQRPALAWLHHDLAVAGFADRTYRPGRAATRGHLIRLLWKEAGRPVVDGPLPWADAPPSLTRALRWLATTPIADLFPGPAIDPDRPLTRGELARALAPSAAPRPAAPAGEAAPAPPVEVVPLPEPPGAPGTRP